MTQQTDVQNQFRVSNVKLMSDFLFKSKTALMFDVLAALWVFLDAPQPFVSQYSNVLWNLFTIALIITAVLQLWTMKRSGAIGKDAYEEAGAPLFTFVSILWALWTAFTVQK